MYKESILDRLINITINLGFSLVNNFFNEKRFDEFKILLNQVLQKAEMDNKNLKDIEVIKNTKIKDFKLNFIEKFFYFKKYQYISKEFLIKNTSIQIKKRYILNILEKLPLLKN